MAHAVGKVGLHLATPLPESSRKKTLAKIRTAIVHLQHRVALIRQSLRPPGKAGRVMPCRAAMRQHDEWQISLGAPTRQGEISRDLHAIGGSIGDTAHRERQYASSVY